ncbi:NAD-binding protein [Mycena venus]|uniref:3-oxoacyl-[acyl-carrier-protein] reductase n=1 Tax=Mycena venus TaxID=2733690 RepID=A0A8H6YXB1_9AGAR|nr:NAD-binding protein [Mycena venus]
MSSKGIAIVTGAAQGIGKGIALRLASDGFDIAVNDIPANADKLSNLVEEIKAKGREASAHVADVSVEEQVKDMVEEVVKIYGGFDVMVANAGVIKYASIEHTTVDDWDRVMAINARGTFLCFKYAGMQMISQGRGGRIIGACSVGGKKGRFSINPKFYELNGYSGSRWPDDECILRIKVCYPWPDTVGCEYGGHGITVNSYAPGTTDTEMVTYLDKSHAELTGSAPGTFKKQLEKTMPLPMIATPDDIAALVSFIASKESQFITGQSISINGGMYFD